MEYYILRARKIPVLLKFNVSKAKVFNIGISSLFIFEAVNQYTSIMVSESETPTLINAIMFDYIKSKLTAQDVLDGRVEITRFKDYNLHGYEIKKGMFIQLYGTSVNNDIVVLISYKRVK